MSIEAQELTKVFGDQVAVRQVSLHIPPGEIYGLIGPNGAGKTTTLRMLAGLMRPTAGSAAICGLDVVSQEIQAKARLGFLTGSTGLYARLTVDELLVYFGRLNSLPLEQCQRRAAELKMELRIQHLAHRLCGKLSTGERQRVSLARAMVHDPEVLILDEPTSGLDVLASRFVADFIRRARQRQRAVLFSTHYMTEAELLCDRVGLIYQGELVWEGPPAELRQQQDAASLEEAFLRLIDPAQQPRPSAQSPETAP